ncbi:hypothetical protein NDA11_004825 [Ustilago hordei]|uniref:Uncharacterized protein n=1 Tax=Ustilago hordei TaxID=120017 RepID=I2FU43_USTHO|nr:uncharacterized protein UHO2_04841 [Ustilago hordei]KAJ1577558.1 hypothetical protein NDA11_004825 [Ustilago hordei]KAJ1597727.1 hypothetical protein NDA14_002277 [Ustilago hordei]UTT89445.1 hypothetical protein NDA17_004108 [Ustilago hordei]CCF50436.1 uncharacterized protein UHOR_05589 [Ustilago hordei]SYW82907.1 uncharacterized protein UHO2_04841 [Ustilago hordei]
MKECFSRSHALLGLLALTLLASLFRGASAYEDPEEAINRRHQAELRTFREKYTRTFVYDLAKHPRPIWADIIREYPKGITDRANHLLQYGYHQKRPITEAEDVVNKLKAIDTRAETLVVGPFHPKLVEIQLDTIRKKHLDTFSGLAKWISDNFDELVRMEDRRETASRLQRYQNIRDLAALAIDIPHR